MPGQEVGIGAFGGVGRVGGRFGCLTPSYPLRCPCRGEKPPGRQRSREGRAV